jgi:hypothetical protein
MRGSWLASARKQPRTSYGEGEAFIHELVPQPELEIRSSCHDHMAADRNIFIVHCPLDLIALPDNGSPSLTAGAPSTKS